ncbi:MAG: hypothetical protein AB9880_05005 [Christensenellales bacterium]
MKPSHRKLAFLLALFLALWVSGAALAVGELTLAEERFFVLPKETYYEGVVYARLENTGDMPIQLTGGLIELLGRDGLAVGSANLQYFDANPEVMLPGESGYISTAISVKEATEPGYIADYTLSVLGTGNVTRTVTRFKSTAEFVRIDDKKKVRDYINALVLNETEEPVFDFYVTYLLRDAQGNIIYSDVMTYAYTGLMPGASTLLRAEVKESVVAWMEAHHMMDALAEAVAFTSSPK